MYLNIGAKLKMIAKVVFWVLTVAVEIFGVLLVTRVIPGAWFSLDVFGTLLVMALAPAVFWLLTVVLYAAGHLIENSEIRTDLAVRTAAAQGVIPKDSILPGEDRAPHRAPPQAYSGAAPQPYVRAPYAGAVPPQPYGARPQPYPPQAYAAPQPQVRPMPQAPQQVPQVQTMQPPVPQPVQQPVQQETVQPEQETRPEPRETAQEEPQRVPYVTPPPAPWDMPKEVQENRE
ncbi:MAG: hypothetical protein IK127_03735 [Clostridia bacterium]|nr:hypothetical protein [Clostridia bacterium]